MSRFNLNGEEIEVYIKTNCLNERNVVIANRTKNKEFTALVFNGKSNAELYYKKYDYIIEFLGGERID